MRALITGAVGDIERFFYHSRPTMERYAERHGYDLLDGPWDTNGRDGYWMKLAAILGTWSRFNEVLWVDADVIITEDAPDIFDEVPGSRWLGIAEHASAKEGPHPNVGVMAIRTVPQARRFFLKAWRRYGRYPGHRWNDQVPVMDLLGYSTTFPVTWRGPTEYTEGVQMLNREWNALPRFGESGYFLHFAGVPVDVRLGMLHKLITGAPR